MAALPAPRSVLLLLHIWREYNYSFVPTHYTLITPLLSSIFQLRQLQVYRTSPRSPSISTESFRKKFINLLPFYEIKIQSHRIGPPKRSLHQSISERVVKNLNDRQVCALDDSINVRATPISDLKIFTQREIVRKISPWLPTLISWNK